MKKSDAKTYWTKLKNYLGLGKMDPQLPKELKIEEKVVSGEVAKIAGKRPFKDDSDR